MAQPGDFSFINSDFDRPYLADMYQAITEAGAWEEMKSDPGEGGYMFGKQDVSNKITPFMKLADQHSGASFAICMRNMQYIAKNGWNNYVRFTQSRG